MGFDDELLFKKINDLIIKTVISVEHLVNNANEMFCPYPKFNCFELFGFDVLVDEELNPWLLEVNLTPALGCDSPLDQKIKANVVSDLFTVCGLVSQDARFGDPVQLKKQAYLGAMTVHNGLLNKKPAASKSKSVVREIAPQPSRTAGSGAYNDLSNKEGTKEEKSALLDTIQEN